ncbi:MAG: glycosyltransferase [Sulfuricellaceae bacterium]|nr:glycosyltransferase [Sulfuricellaceae bacterium]
MLYRRLRKIGQAVRQSFAVTSPRTHLLINYPKFPAHLKQGLAERGIVLVENDWQPGPNLLQQTLACVVGFNVGNIKHPLRALMWKRHLLRYGVPVFTWNRDAPYHNNLPAWRLAVFDYLRLLDIYATHSLIDTRWRFAESVLYLPNAAATSAYNLRGESESVLARLRDPGQYRWDVSFFGILNGDIYKEAVVRKDFFDVLEARLDAMNIRHYFVDSSTTPMSTDEQVEMIQTSRINLNFGAYCDYSNYPDYPASGLPERFFGIPACGGFLLADRRTHTVDSFEIGHHMDDFTDIDDCVEKIHRHLVNFERSREIAEAGWRHVMRYHTYANRAETMHKSMLDWHAGRRGLTFDPIE